MGESQSRKLSAVDRDDDYPWSAHSEQGRATTGRAPSHVRHEENSASIPPDRIEIPSGPSRTARSDSGSSEDPSLTRTPEARRAGAPPVPPRREAGEVFLKRTYSGQAGGRDVRAWGDLDRESGEDSDAAEHLTMRHTPAVTPAVRWYRQAASGLDDPLLTRCVDYDEPSFSVVGRIAAADKQRDGEHDDEHSVMAEVAEDEGKEPGGADERRSSTELDTTVSSNWPSWEEMDKIAARGEKGSRAEVAGRWHREVAASREVGAGEKDRQRHPARSARGPPAQRSSRKFETAEAFAPFFSSIRAADEAGTAASDKGSSDSIEEAGAAERSYGTVPASARDTVAASDICAKPLSRTVRDASRERARGPSTPEDQVASSVYHSDDDAIQEDYVKAMADTRSEATATRKFALGEPGSRRDVLNAEELRAHPDASAADGPRHIDEHPEATMNTDDEREIDVFDPCDSIEDLRAMRDQKLAQLEQLLRTAGFASELEFEEESKQAEACASSDIKWEADYYEEFKLTSAPIATLRTEIAGIDAKLRARARAEFAAALAAFPEFQKDDACFRASYARTLETSKKGTKRKREAANKKLKEWTPVVDAYERLQQLLDSQRIEATSTVAPGAASLDGDSSTATTPSKIVDDSKGDEDEPALFSESRSVLPASSRASTTSSDDSDRRRVARPARSLGHRKDSHLSDAGESIRADSERAVPTINVHRAAREAAVLGADSASRTYACRRVKQTSRQRTSRSRRGWQLVLPTCWEKTLQEIVNVAPGIPRGVPGAKRELVKLIHEVEDRLLEEQDMTEQAQQMLKEIDTAAGVDNFEEVGNLARRLLHHLRPIDLSKLAELIDDGSSVVQMEDHDVVLLLGKTGAGKSTTLVFLAGGKFEEVEVEGTEHLNVVEAPDAVASVKTSPSTVSSTRRITAVTVSASRGELVIVDTPGFLDTRGKETALANAVRMAFAVGTARSVRAVVVMSFNSIGDRFEGVSETAHTLTNFMDVSDDTLEGVEYVFTKASRKHARLLPDRLSAKLRELSPRESADQGYVALLRDMNAKTAGGARCIRPLEDDATEFLEMFSRLRKIPNPQDAFKLFAPQELIDELDRQIELCNQSLENALDRGDIEMATFRLSQLMRLEDIFSRLPAAARRKIDVDCNPRRSVDHIRARITHLHRRLDDAFALIEELSDANMDDAVRAAREAAEQLINLDRIQELALDDADSGIDRFAFLVGHAAHELVSKLPHEQGIDPSEARLIVAVISRLMAMEHGFWDMLDDASTSDLREVTRWCVAEARFLVQQHSESAHAAVAVSAEQSSQRFLHAVYQLEVLQSCEVLADEVGRTLEDLRTHLGRVLRGCESKVHVSVTELVAAVFNQTDTDTSVQAITDCCVFVAAADRHGERLEHFLRMPGVLAECSNSIISYIRSMENCVARLKESPRSLADCKSVRRLVVFLVAMRKLKGVPVIGDIIVRLHTDAVRFLRTVVQERSQEMSKALGDQFSGETTTIGEVAAGLTDLAAIDEAVGRDDDECYKELATLCRKVGDVISHHLRALQSSSDRNTQEACKSASTLSVLLGSGCKLSEDLQQEVRAALTLFVQQLLREMSDESDNVRVSIESGMDVVQVAHVSAGLLGHIRLAASMLGSFDLDEQIQSTTGLWKERMSAFVASCEKLLRKQFEGLVATGRGSETVEEDAARFVARLSDVRQAHAKLSRDAVSKPAAAVALETVDAAVAHVLESLRSVWIAFTDEILPAYHAGMSEAARTIDTASFETVDDTVNDRCTRCVVVAAQLSKLDDWKESQVKFGALQRVLGGALAQRRKESVGQLRLLASNDEYQECASLFTRLVADGVQSEVLVGELELVAAQLAERVERHLGVRMQLNLSAQRTITAALNDALTTEYALQELAVHLSEALSRRAAAGLQELQSKVSDMLHSAATEMECALADNEFGAVVAKIKLLHGIVEGTKCASNAGKRESTTLREFDNAITTAVQSLGEFLQLRVLHYKEVDWTQLASDPPRPLFRCLENLSKEALLAEAVEAERLFQELRDHFISRAQHLIASVRGDTAGPAEEDTLRMVSDLAKHLPKAVFESFSSDLVEAAGEAKKRSRAEEARAAEEASSGGLSKLLTGLTQALCDRKRLGISVRVPKIEGPIKMKAKILIKKISEGQLSAGVRKTLVRTFSDWEQFANWQGEWATQLEWLRCEPQFAFIHDPAQSRALRDSVVEELHWLFRRSFENIIADLSHTSAVEDLASLDAELGHCAEYIALWSSYEDTNVEKQPSHIFSFIRQRTGEDAERRASPVPSGVLASATLEDLILQAFSAIAKYFQAVQTRFRDLLTRMDVRVLEKELAKLDSVGRELDRVAHFASSSLRLRSASKQAQSLSTLALHTWCRNELSGRLLSLIDFVCKAEVPSDERAWSDNGHERNAFYVALVAAWKQLKDVGMLRTYVDPRVVDLDGVQQRARQSLRVQLVAVRDVGLRLAAQPTLSRRDYRELNIAYENLKSMSNHFDGTDLCATAEQYKDDTRREVESRVEDMCARARHSADAEEFAIALREIKQVSVQAPALKAVADAALDKLLSDVSVTATDPRFIPTVATILQLDAPGIDVETGQRLIQEHDVFEKVAIDLRFRKTQLQDINYVLKHIEQDKRGWSGRLNKRRLRDLFDTFDSKYWHHVHAGYLNPSMYLEKLVADAVQISETSKSYSDRAKGLLPLVFAHLTLSHKVAQSRKAKMKTGSGDTASQCAGGAGGAGGPDVSGGVKGARKAKQVARESTTRAPGLAVSELFQPHPAQTVAVIRMLGLDASKMESCLHNQLIEIRTGEGKSVVISVVATVLALVGYEVDCACYSSYLSRRDHEAFLPLFQAFGVADNVTFGTFEAMCERFLNRRGDIRKLTAAAIMGERTDEPVTDAARRKKSKHILIIDEVDVFFDKAFTGNLYQPLCELQDPTVVALAMHIWTNRKSESSIRLDNVRTSAAYIACTRRYPGSEDLVDEATKRMLCDVQSYAEIEYTLSPTGRIGHREHDGISFDIRYGYKTMFLYFHEHEKGTITEKQRDRHIALAFECGSFSYAEIPSQYATIMGVSGTLKDLSQPEKDVLKSTYKIKDFTFIPSVYGSNQLRFRPDDPTFVVLEDEERHHDTLAREISRRMVGDIESVSRAVMVFFATSSELFAFYDSPQMRALKRRVRVLTPDVSEDDKAGIIEQAATQGAVTLLTREFGRGTDFKCYDSRLVSSGGVHVIQTFVSDHVSEETQIKGRTARQGDVGSFSMVLKKEKLGRFGMGDAEFRSIEAGGGIYSTICKYRGEWFQRTYAERQRNLTEFRQDHKQSDKFVENLLNGNASAVHAFLVKCNTYHAPPTSIVSRTVILIDGTYSMGELLDKTKNTVRTTYRRAREIIAEKKPGADFVVQIAIYRNYDCKVDRIFRSSGFESSPGNLKTFLETVEPDGGWDREAIEIGFAHVNEIIQSGNEVAQVILLGDRGPNSKDGVRYKRERLHGSEYWRSTKYSIPTDVDSEILKLKASKVPVHAFHVKKGGDAETDFHRIAAETGGESHFLDVTARDGAAHLIDVLTRRILDSVGGDTLVTEYEARYMPGYVAHTEETGAAVGDAVAAGGAGGPASTAAE